MIELLTNLSTAFGLSASAGLNAYIPLFIVAVVARYTNWITLTAPYDVLTSGWVIAALGVLLVVEFFADKVPLIDHVNDAIGSFIRPAAGALLFAANTSAVQDIHPALAIVAGLLVAGSVHAAKATARPIVTASTGGIGNPIVSTVEDVTATVVSLGAILLPVVFAFLVLIALVGVLLLIRSFRRRRSLRTRPGM